ncbi:mite allergen Der f 3-like [Culicoides brevitarsis]|uniref:mite allergen Der f 3-like n=1 Tax=Culicoides brevitarsis TaxID=469753 RepID=UPI00307B7007
MALLQLLLLAFVGTAFSAQMSLSRSTEMNPFIVGGTPTTVEEFPFTVACYYGSGFSCGGSILNEYWILTAAHCTCTAIQWGVTNRNYNGPNVYNVVQNVRHPNYVSYVADDIQLLRLDKPIEFGAQAQPVKLPYSQWEVEGPSFQTPAAVIGWGRDNNGNTPVQLHRGDYFVINNEDCKQIHQSAGLAIYDFNCCNGVRGGGVADCNGDSGGPIVTWKDGVMVQYGIVSWSVKPCINPTYPAVGTKTSHYIAWISSVTGIPESSLTI